VTGGEPTLSDPFWKLVDWFSEEASHIALAVNSNLGAPDHLIDRLVEKSHSIPEISLYTSNESLGIQAEYIRDGLRYDIWTRNLEKMLRSGNFKLVNVMMTINALCLASVVEFLDYLMELKDRYPVLTFSVNLLRNPSFQSPDVLPPEIKLEISAKLREWIKKQDHRKDFDYEKFHVIRLADYLELVNAPSKDLPDLLHDFYQFYSDYDVRRKKNFRTTFPRNFVEWFESLKPRDPPIMETV
jgi:hypothetical protein